MYIIDREYVTVKEAKKIERHKFGKDEVDFTLPADAPDLDRATAILIHRVNNIDQEIVRTHLTADHRYVNPHPAKNRTGLGYRALDLLKNLFGISQYKMNKHNREHWNDFRREQMRENNSRFQREE